MSEPELRRVHEALAAFEAHGRRLTLWWRDDDAVAPTPALDRLLALSRRFELPLALAVIPAEVGPDLAARLVEEPGVAVLQHGWQHRNHAGPGEKKAELGAHRPVDAILDELGRGRECMQSLFPTFLPVLVPPWNRIAPGIAAALPSLGFAGLSTYGAAAATNQVNTHLDILAWKPVRRPFSRAEAFSLLAAELERRLASDEPLGILTHHLVHDDESWTLLGDLLSLLATHPAATWPPICALFSPAAEQPAPSGVSHREA
jgi:peptidoglycan/xylan/chitin deacetylase (PgdA/CDA1 family)